MDQEDKKNFKERMGSIVESGKEQDLGENPSGLLVSGSDFPDLNNMNTPEITKYREEMEQCQAKSIEVIKNLASLWLDGDQNVLNQPYIQARIERDARSQGQQDFLSSVAQQVLLKQLNLMEQGDQSPRHFEIIYKGMGELEKINKSSANSLAMVENYYRKLRYDLGFEDMPKFGREKKKEEKETKAAFTGNMKDLNKFLEAQAKAAVEAETKKAKPGDSKSEHKE